MAQITIYLPDDVAREVRQKARASHMSVSSYFARLAGASSREITWPEGFADLFGSCSLSVPEDPPPEEVTGL